MSRHPSSESPCDRSVAPRALAPDEAARQRRWIHAPLVVACLLALTLGAAPAAARAKGDKAAKDKKSKASAAAPTAATPIEFTPFGEKNGDEAFNTSSILPVSDGVFLLVDNRIDDAMLELRLDDHGVKREPLVRRPLADLPPGIVDDLEATTWVDSGDEPFIVATSSFNRKHTYDAQRKMVPIDGYADGLLRIRRDKDGALRAEHVGGFRVWLVAAYERELGPIADKIPDEGGLNIEGLEWDRERQALLFGLRSPLQAGRPIVLPVRVKDVDGPWSLDQFEALPPVVVPIEASEVGWGIRGIGRPERGKGFLVSVGKGWQGRRVPFQLYLWDGASSAQRFADIVVAHGNKPEGVCVGTVGERVAGILADDSGGYAVIFEDDPRIDAIAGPETSTRAKKKKKK